MHLIVMSVTQNRVRKAMGMSWLGVRLGAASRVPSQDKEHASQPCSKESVSFAPGAVFEVGGLCSS